MLRTLTSVAVLVPLAVACLSGCGSATPVLPVETEGVLVAIARIPSWQPIKEPEKVFVIRLFSKDVASPGAIGTFEAVKDKMLVRVLDEGDPVTEDDLVDKDLQDMAFKIRPGQRAVVIKVATPGPEGDFPRVGDLIDVAAETHETKTVVSDVFLFAWDSIDMRQKPSTVNVVVALTTEETDAIAQMQRQGAKLSIRLRAKDKAKK